MSVWEQKYRALVALVRLQHERIHTEQQVPKDGTFTDAYSRGLHDATTEVIRTAFEVEHFKWGNEK